VKWAIAQAPEMEYVIPSVARNLALVCGGGNRSEIPRYARNDIEPAGKGRPLQEGRIASGAKNSWN
jgi:hypothetical protein